MWRQLRIVFLEAGRRRVSVRIGGVPGRKMSICVPIARFRTSSAWPCRLRCARRLRLQVAQTAEPVQPVADHGIILFGASGRQARTT